MKKYFISFLFLFLFACGSTDISRFYYIIDGSKTNALREKPFKERCFVNNFKVSSWLRTRDIPVRPTANRIDYYDQYAWITVPSILFAEYTYEAVRKSNLFTQVVRTGEESGVQIAIDGFLDHLEVVQKNDSVFTWIEGEITCKNMVKNKQIIRHRFKGFVPIKGDATAGKFVEICRDVYSGELYTFLKKCDQALAAGN